MRLLFLAALPLLAACEMIYAAAGFATGAELVSVVSTQKTLGDHVRSYRTGQDCSLVRASEGGRYCEPYPLRPQPPPPRKPTYCYRTLADVTCFLEPMQNSTDQLLGREEMYKQD